MNWETKLLEEVVEYFIDYRGKTPNKTTSGIPLVTAKIVKNGALLEPDEFISEEDYPLWMTRGFPEINDVVLTTEAPLGEVALIKDRNVALAQRIITLRGFKDKLDNKFLKYWFQSEYGQYELDSRASGTTVFGIKASVLKKIPVPVPSLPEQQAIASVLSALDDKIDLLQRQNQTLEQMAATLFRQWFIEEAKEDWETYCLKDLANIYIGRTPPRKESHWFSNSNKDYKWISIKDMADSGTFTIQTNEYLSKNTIDSFKIPVIPTNTVILSFKMTVGRVKITLEDMVSNEAIAQFQIKKLISKEFLYCFLKQYNFDTLGSTSSIVTAVNTALIKDIEVTIPNTELVEKFTDITYSMFNKIRDNQIQIQTLQSMRDTLLPKLISGEVRLKGFETLLQA